MSSNFQAVLSEVLPLAPFGVRVQIDGDLDAAERALREIAFQAKEALDALVAAKDETLSADDRDRALGKALGYARSAGASGPLGSQHETAMHRLSRVDAAIRTADAMGKAAQA